MSEGIAAHPRFRLAAVGGVLAMTAALSLAVTMEGPPSLEEEAQAAEPAATSRDRLRALLAADAFPWLAPKSLPEGMHLVAASLEPGEEGGRRCPAVQLRWQGGPAPEGRPGLGDEPPATPELTITMSPAACGSDAEEGAERFSAGPHQGTIDRPSPDADEPYLAVYLTTGETRATIVTDLPEDEVRKVAEGLEPFDRETG